MPALSVIIPARSEMFLKRTIDDILEHAEGDTNVIAVLDGQFAEPPIPDHPRVTLIYNPKSIGQRAACNQAARLSRAKYVAKCDAHCAFDQGFDVKLMADIEDDVTMVPTMKNLHAFDWVCSDGHRQYQSNPPPCKQCGKTMEVDVVWQPKRSPNSRSYCFDSTPHFQYAGDWTKRPEGQGPLSETMSLQGSFFMMTREKYFALEINDEAFGSWGSQGLEVAIKTWLSGGRVLCNHKTYYAHMFRSSVGFKFPYQNPGRHAERAKARARDLFFNNKWPKAIRPLSWLVERFWPVRGWSDEDLRKLKESERNNV